MNPSIRGIVLGLLAVAVFDAIVSRPGAAAATGGAWKFANDALERFVSPALAVFGPARLPAKTGS